MQPVGQDVLHKLQMKKDKWRRQAKLDAVEELLWGRQPHHGLKQRLCTALGRTATSLLHDASLALDDLSIVIAPGQSPKVEWLSKATSLFKWSAGSCCLYNKP